MLQKANDVVDCYKRVHAGYKFLVANEMMENMLRQMKHSLDTVNHLVT